MSISSIIEPIKERKMEVQKFLNGFDCVCGKRHDCPIKFVYIEKGAINRLKEVTTPFNNVLIVADQNTYGVAGQKVSDKLGEKIKEKVIFSGEKVVIPNEASVERIENATLGIDLIVGIGSGVIQDLCKFVSNSKKIPYIIVATAPSMDGYASNGAAMITKGMKVTYTVGLPFAIIGDVDILKDAPMDMIKSGYGDIIGKYSSLNDWKLSKEVNGEYFCDYVYSVTESVVKETVALADGILKRDEESIKVLTEGLILTGIMISYVSTSRPASGSEHHLSHFFEINGIVQDTPYLSHGTDVAYSTIITAEIRENLLNSDFSAVYKQDEQEKKRNLQRLFGVVAKECEVLQEKLGTYRRDRNIIYREKEREIKNILKEMPSAKEIQEILGRVGFSLEDFYAFYGTKKIKDAVKYAKDLKDRYTVLWLNYDLNGGVL